MKYRSKLGTVINIPDGLSQKEVDRIKADADSGYGTRAQQTANKMGKRSGKKKPTEETPPADPNDMFNNDTGMINDPDQVLKNMPNFETFRGEIEKAAQANEAYLTRDFADQEAKRMEATKQELAERGIPYNPQAGNLYGDTVGTIQKQFDDQRQNARNLSYSQALDTGFQSYGTSLDAFLKAVTGLNDQALSKYGIDKDYLAKIKAIKAQREAQARSGGGGGSSSGGGGGGGGGFDVQF